MNHANMKNFHSLLLLLYFFLFAFEFQLFNHYSIISFLLVGCLVLYVCVMCLLAIELSVRKHLLPVDDRSLLIFNTIFFICIVNMIYARSGSLCLIRVILFALVHQLFPFEQSENRIKGFKTERKEQIRKMVFGHESMNRTGTVSRTSIHPQTMKKIESIQTKCLVIEWIILAMEFMLLKYQQEIFTVNKSKLSCFHSAQRDQLSILCVSLSLLRKSF